MAEAHKIDERKIQEDPGHVDEHKTLEEELDRLLLAIMAIHEKDCVVAATLDYTVKIAQILARISGEGLPDEYIEEMSLALDALVKKTGVSVSEHVTPIQKGHIILHSDLSRIEKTIAGPISLCLEAHLEFQRNLLTQQRRDFQTGNNKIVFFHPITGQEIGPYDKNTLELLIKTRAMMLFPDLKKHRTIREQLENVHPHNLVLTNDEKIGRIIGKRYKRIKSIGVVFKVQCEHWAVGRKRRSLNIIMEVAARGFFNKWEELGINVGAAYKHWPEFKSVRHLLAAYIALTGTDKKTNPEADQAGAFGVHFMSFIISPGRFFLVADRYRQWALEAGMIKRKTELWMPKKWKTLIQEDLPSLEMGDIDPDYPDEIRRFDEFEKAYRDNKGWMR